MTVRMRREAFPSRTGSAQRTGRLDYLDGLRAIAVGVVFIMHVSEIFIRVTPHGRLIFPLFYATNMGRVGVVTFFAISGFLIPSSLFGSASAGTVRFAITRAFRLFPAYLLSLPASATSYQLMTQGQHFTWHQFLLNMTMVPRFFDVDMLNGAYWTLEVEYAFYAICTFLFLGGVLRNAFVLAALLGGLQFLFYSSQAALWHGMFNPALSGEAFFFSLNLACMFWGAVIRRWWDGEKLNAVTVTLFAWFSIYWLVYLPAKLLLTETGAIAGSMDMRLVLGYAIGLWIFLLGISVVRITWRPAILLGRISYSFYLLHQAGLYAVYAVVLHNRSLRGLPMPLYIAASFIISVALAAGCFVVIERPFIRYGKRLTRWLLGNAHAPEVQAKPGLSESKGVAFTGAP